MKEETRPADEAKKRSYLPCGCQMLLGFAVILILAGVALGPIGHGRGFQ